MNADQRIDGRDLEQTDDAGVDGDDPKGPTRVREPARGGHKRAYSGRVEKRAAREVEYDDLGLTMDTAMSLVNVGGHADTVLAACVVGLHAFWRERAPTTRPRLTIPASRTRKPH